MSDPLYSALTSEYPLFRYQSSNVGDPKSTT